MGHLFYFSAVSSESPSKRQSWIILLLLVLAGEGIFVLPFILVRIFRPTFLEVYELSNEEMGYCFSTYGIVALISYLLGGSLADRFKPRYLIAVSLWMTAAAGFWMAAIPSYNEMIMIYGFFGFSTIFLFWSALIKTTRIWGGELSQGQVFGILDGGRGLVGSAFGFLGLAVFATVITSQSNC